MLEYNHTQSTPSTTWTITHNLNTTSVVTDTSINFGGNLEKILPLNVVLTDANTLTVTFSSAQTGKVRIVA